MQKAIYQKPFKTVAEQIALLDAANFTDAAKHAKAVSRLQNVAKTAPAKSKRTF